MHNTLVITGITLSFIVASVLINFESNNMVSALSLNSLKDKASNILGMGNSNNSASSTNTNNSSSSSIAADNPNSSGSSLKDKATNVIGNLLK